MNKKVAYILGSIVILAIWIAVGGYYGYRHYRISTLNSKIEESLGRDAGYTDTILKVEQEASGMNYRIIRPLRKIH